MSAAPIVVKLGGAQAHGPWLKGWLEALAACAGRVVVVPGGGPFADTVRAQQSLIGFDDEAAHDMAMLAMAQFGRALAGMRPGFDLVEEESELRASLAQGRTPVWVPLRMANAAGLAASWDTTSDSLAAWLAGRLGASRLILVKHGEAASWRVLAAQGVVDNNFPAYLAASGARACLAAPERPDLLAAALEDKALPLIEWRGEAWLKPSVESVQGVATPIVSAGPQGDAEAIVCLQGDPGTCADGLDLAARARL